MKTFLKYFGIGALMILLGCFIAFYGYWVGLCFANIHTVESSWRAILCFFLALAQLVALIMLIAGFGGIFMCEKKSSKEKNHEELS